MTLDNKTILITGANRGIGRALAEEFAKKPVNLLLGMRDISSYKPIKAGNAISIKPIVLDLSSQKSIDTSLDKYHEDLSKLDILVNNAGQFVAGAAQKQDTDKTYQMFQVNIVGLIHLTNRLLPLLLKRPEAKIVNNASIAGYAFFPFNSSYSATKAGVIAYSIALRRELRSTAVSVLYLTTPGVDTDMMNDVEATYKSLNNTIELAKIKPQVWARKVIKAVEKDKKVLHPGGKNNIILALSVGPQFIMDIVSRRIVG